MDRYERSLETGSKIKTMNQEKLNYLTKLAETVEQTPKDKLMPLFMSMAAGSGQFQLQTRKQIFWYPL